MCMVTRNVRNSARRHQRDIPNCLGCWLKMPLVPFQTMWNSYFYLEKFPINEIFKLHRTNCFLEVITIVELLGIQSSIFYLMVAGFIHDQHLQPPRWLSSNFLRGWGFHYPSHLTIEKNHGTNSDELELPSSSSMAFYSVHTPKLTARAVHPGDRKPLTCHIWTMSYTHYFGAIGNRPSFPSESIVEPEKVLICVDHVTSSHFWNHIWNHLWCLPALTVARPTPWHRDCTARGIVVDVVIPHKPEKHGILFNLKILKKTLKKMAKHGLMVANHSVESRGVEDMTRLASKVKRRCNRQLPSCDRHIVSASKKFIMPWFPWILEADFCEFFFLQRTGEPNILKSSAVKTLLCVFLAGSGLGLVTLHPNRRMNRFLDFEPQPFLGLPLQQGKECPVGSVARNPS